MVELVDPEPQKIFSVVTCCVGLP